MNPTSPHEYPQPTRRASAFVETGLVDDEPLAALVASHSPVRPRLKVRFRSTNSIIKTRPDDIHPGDENEWEDVESDNDEPTIKLVAPLRPRTHMTLLNRLSLVAIIMACAIALTQYTTVLGPPERPYLGATGLPVADAAAIPDSLYRRQSQSPTDVCKRWSQQSAIVNGTLYLYGGQATNSSGQTSDTWNNDFVTIDLTKTWQISSPAMSGLSQPDGPPPVANGYLWSSYDSLYLYGGEFSDKPQVDPTENSMWQYDIKSQAWTQFSNPMTSSGVNSEPAGEPIERAAEGAGFSLAALGKGWYFGGHLDFKTTKDWSIQTPRLYLRSFIEYTFPGYATSNGSIAGSQGEWRNITNAGIQDQAGFTERADGIVVYVPGFTKDGILLSLGGGTNVSFTQMNEVDVYDIAGSRWYRQATSGPTPNVRVDPCAVVAAAADGSSYNVYMFGGQNLTPYNNQTQYNDMWILSVPSFEWISVDMKGQSVPYPRAGHTCNIWDGQMVVVGGYIGAEIGCEQPGVYVFNMSSLQWGNQFTARTQDKSSDPFSQQTNQKGNNATSGLEGSYGYQVPQAVIASIGGDPLGKATITAPVATPTGGPLASGKPITYTVTGPNGQAITEGSSFGGSSSSGPNVGAIVAGSIAGVLLIATIYLGFCALLYRKQLKLYKNHVAMTQRAAVNPNSAEKYSFYAPGVGGTRGGDRLLHSRDNSWQRSSDNEPLSGPPSGPRHGASDSFGGQSTSTGRGSLQGGYRSLGASSEDNHSTEDLLGGMEPTFVGVMLHPRRSLRVVNRD